MAKRNNPLAPYYVQMREYERRLINGALDQVRGNFDERLRMAADLLGVTPKYVRVRARLLGGVIPGEPKQEPPSSSCGVWAEHGRKPKPPKLTIVKEAKPDA
jgi:hypothetical protein